MSERVEVRVPDLGGAEGVRVVEVLVGPGAAVADQEGLVTLESDKAAMDIPSPAAGVVVEIRLARGQEVHSGDVVAILEAAAAAPPEVDTAPAAGAAAGAARAAATARPVAAAPPLHAEVLVLGGGPGGYTAAFRAADLGKEVVLVERYPHLGGVCLNVGCIPSKALLHVARVIEEARDLAAHGVDLGPPRLDLERLRAFKDGVVRRMTGGLGALAERRRVGRLEGFGRFASPHELAVDTPGGVVTVGFDHAIVAVGSQAARLPGLPQDPRIWDSTAALALPEVPGRLLLVGGGIIGLEMAMVYGSLGSRLTVVELLDGLVPGCDRDLVRPLQRRLEQRMGASIHLQARVAAVEPTPDGLRVTFAGEKAPEPALFDRLLVAVGRRASGDAIRAEAAGIAVDERGTIPVDRQLRTSVPHIHAIGDVTGGPMLAHRAAHQGKAAAEIIATGRGAFDARVIPSVAYTDPEIAWAGLTENDARRDGTAYEKAAFPWSASGRSLGMGRDDGLTKLLFDPASRRLLGAGIVGPGAGDLISEAALAIEMGCEAADLGLTIHPHPTLSETLAFAAEVFEGTVTDILAPRRRVDRERTR